METENTAPGNGIMDLTDLEEITRVLAKWDKYPTKTIMNHLATLKNVSITRSDLKKTNIHKSISNLSKIRINCAEKRTIKNLAGLIRDSWKKQLDASKADIAEAKKSVDRVPAEPRANSPQKRPSATLDLPDLHDSSRNRALKMLVDLFSDEKVKTYMAEKSEETFQVNSQTILEKSLQIERGIFEHAEENEYVNYIRTRILLLKEKANFGLKIRVLTGQLPVEEFSQWSLDELSDRSQKLKAAAMRYVAGAKQSDFHMKNMTFKAGEFMCSKCKGKKIMINQRQMRSADEPMTVFHHCTDCDHRWKTN